MIVDWLLANNELCMDKRLVYVCKTFDIQKWKSAVQAGSNSKHVGRHESCVVVVCSGYSTGRHQ